MLIICFTYTQFFIKWFHWMIQFYSDNVIFLILKQSAPDLRQAPKTYCANVIRFLFDLLKKVFNLATSFLFFMISLFRYFYEYLGLLDTSFFYFLIVMQDFLGISFTDTLFAFCYFLNFHGIHSFYIPAADNDVTDTLFSWCLIFPIFFFYILFYRIFHCQISIKKPVFSFPDYHSTSLICHTNLFTALRIIDSFLVHR